MPATHRIQTGHHCPLEQHLETVQEVISYVCRRRGIRGEEAEDFRSWVMVRLLDNDRRVLREFRGQSKLSTFLTRAILNMAHDFRIQKWGRWRPSSAARRLGTVAQRLERLTARDGRSYHEATETLRRHYGLRMSAAEFDELWSQLPSRALPTRPDSTDLDDLRSNRESDHGLQSTEQLETLARAQQAVNSALSTLPLEDRLILKKRFREGLTIATIARTLGKLQRPLYDRVRKCLNRLARDVSLLGVDPQATLEAMGGSSADFLIDFGIPASPAEPAQHHCANLGLLGAGASAPAQCSHRTAPSTLA